MKKVILAVCCMLFYPLLSIRARQEQAGGKSGSAYFEVVNQNADDYVNAWMRDQRIPGLSLAVLKEGRLMKATGYGMANLETNSPATAETVYKTASLSKQVIAAAILLLAQDGKISLEDKANRYLDGAPEAWKEITIRHLLTHTSGIARDPADYHPYHEQPIGDVIKSVYSLPLDFPPGEKWLYSNVGYYVLAEIITRASGKPWDEFIVERLFKPAGMNSTRITIAADIVPHRASGYEHTEHGLINAENWIAVRPSGAFLSTVLDLAKWDTWLDSTDALRAESRKAMWTPATLNDKTPVHYGFGWSIDSYLGHARIHHDGQFPGFRADYERFADNKLTVIVLANADQPSLDRLSLKLAGFYEPALEAPPFVLSAAVRTGKTPSGNPVSVTVTAKDDGQAAPDSIVEMEIWDASGKTVYKQHQADANFAAGQTKTYVFSWTPEKDGEYTVNVGAYGPGWVPSFAWKLKAATITVN